MKKIFLSAILAAAAALPTFAAVDTLNYSAVVRNSDGQPVANQEVTLQFQFLEDNTVKFEETATVTTSAAGVVNYAIGSTQSLEDVDWTANNIKLAVSIDVNGGADLTLLSNSNVASVPTALYALKSADTENLYNDVDAIYGQLQRNENVQNDIFAKISLAEEDIDALYGKAERTEYQINQIAADFANLGENLDNSFAQVTAIDEKVESLIENLDNSFARVEVMEEQVEANTTAIAEVKKDAYDAFEDIYQQLGAIDQIVEAVETLNAWHLDNDETILSLPATLNAMNEAIEENTNKLEEMEQANANLVVTLQTLDNMGNENAEAIEALNEKVTEIKDHAYEAFEDIYQQLGLVETIASTLTDYIEQDQIVSGKVEQMEGTVNFLREENDANVADINALQEADQRFQTVQNDIFAKIGEVQEDIEALQGADQRFQTMYNNMVADLGLSKDDIEALQGKDERFEVQISELQGDIAGLQNAIETQNALDARWKDQLNEGLFELTDNVEKNTEDIANIYGLIDRLNFLIEELQNKVAENHPSPDITE